MELLACGESSQEIHQCQDERMFVSDDVSGRPEIFDVGVSRTSNKNLVTTLHRFLISQIEKGEVVHSLHIEFNGPLRAVNLEAVSVVISGCETRRFKGS